ncbi:MAG: extracellular solute-binding protein [Proteobacteria bacterium]|nr:extracellular solute-binding protein [Pseudomonadota bacterium]
MISIRRIVAQTVASTALIWAASGLPAHAAEITFWTNLTTASQANVIQKQANACAARQPDLQVKFETVPFGSMYTRLITAMRRNDLPNIMNTLEGAVAFVQAKNGLVPVTDIVAELGKNDFLASYLNAVSKDEQVWGLPDWALHQEVWYRKDLFERAGLKVPNSWDELLVAAKALNQAAADGKPQVYGFAVPMGRALVAPQTYFQVFYAAGGTIFDPKTGGYVFGDQKALAVRSLQFLIDLYKAASPPASVEWSWAEYRTAFVKGQVAMTNEWGAVVQMAAEQNPEILDKMGVFPFPGPSADKKPVASLSGGYYYLIGKSAPEKVAASKKLLRCMYDPKLVAERANSRPIFAIPATHSAFKSEVYQSNEMVKHFKPQLDIIFNDVMQHWYRYGMEAGLNPLAGQIEATTFIGDAIQNAALGKIKAEAAIDQIDEQLHFQAEILSR